MCQLCDTAAREDGGRADCRAEPMRSIFQGMMVVERWEDSSTALRFAQNDKVKCRYCHPEYPTKRASGIEGSSKADSDKPVGRFFDCATLRSE